MIGILDKHGWTLLDWVVERESTLNKKGPRSMLLADQVVSRSVWDQTWRISWEKTNPRPSKRRRKAHRWTHDRRPRN